MFAGWYLCMWHSESGQEEKLVRVTDPTNTLVPLILKNDNMMNNQVQSIMQKQFLPDHCGDIIKYICWYVWPYMYCIFLGTDIGRPERF